MISCLTCAVILGGGLTARVGYAACCLTGQARADHLYEEPLDY